MSEVAWQTKHSVESLASPEFAWAFMSDVANWEDPPAHFEIDGPFVTGTRGATVIPGQPSRSWELRKVQPIESYTVAFSLDEATLAFTWQFRPVSDSRTRLTQQIVIEGPKAAGYVKQVQQAFSSTLAPGMDKLAIRLNRAYRAVSASGAR